MIRRLRTAEHLAEIEIQHRIQETKFSCGAACVTSILNTEGVWVSEKEVRKAIGTNPEEGTPLPNIRDFFKKLGCKVEMKSAEIQELREMVEARKYAIVSMQMWEKGTDRDWENTWSEGHYCIVKDMNKREIILSDPSRRKLIKLPISVFNVLWHDEDTDGTRYDQYTITITPSKGLKKSAEDFFERQNPRLKDLKK